MKGYVTVDGGRVKVVSGRGHVDWPILYVDGSVGYDFPERVPKYLKVRAYKLLVYLAMKYDSKVTGGKVK
jgi:hypothetical protein